VSADPARTFRDLQRIWSKIFIPENLAASKSWDYLNNTRYLKPFPFDYSPMAFPLNFMLDLVIKAFLSHISLHAQSGSMPTGSPPPPSAPISNLCNNPTRPGSVSFCFKRGYNLPEPPPSKKQRTDSAQPDPDSDTTTGNHSHAGVWRVPGQPSA
jgi:hypothetical protein